MKDLKQFIKETIREYLNENINDDLSIFLSDKKFTNARSKQFLYHGTNISPENFNLRDDYDFEDSNTWSGDLPEGYLFLTTSLKEAKAYGKYVIPCELKNYDSKRFNVNASNPSQIFDRDYGIDLYKNDKYYGFWEKYEESGKSVLVIKGTDRSTIITYVENVIPRIDLANQFYNQFIKETIRECLTESVETDIKFNNEAKNVYNKIKNNIRTIKFTPTPNNNENDIIKDSRGKTHILMGVKFNLNQLYNKYDLEILLVNEIGKASNHHYDSKANRMVFFILSQSQNPMDFDYNSYLARIRFNSWVDENIFIHEFIHFLDFNRYSDTYSFSTPQNDDQYYNSPEEYNAYTQEIIKQVIKNKNKLIGLSFDLFLKKILTYGRKEFISNLNDEYKKKLKKRLYKIYSELNIS